MNVRKTLNWDKLAIVLSVAVITLALMAQTMYANGAARVNGAAASGSLSYQTDATDTGDGGGGISDATDTGDGGGGIGDGTDTDDDDLEIGDATDTDDGPRGDKPIPPGQLIRRGINGTIVAVGEGFVVIETKFGNVTINVGDSSGFEIGDRFAALLDRSPLPPSDATDTTDGTSDASGTTDSFRTVTALRVKKIPGKPLRAHLRSVVVDSATDTDDGDTLTILDDDGNEIELQNDGASGTLDGEDTILLIMGQGVGPPVVIGGITSSSVQKRLEKLLQEASPERQAKLEGLIQKRLERLEARLQRIEDRAPNDRKNQVRGARDKSTGKGGGKPDDKGASSGGGGKPDDKGKGSSGGGGKGKNK